MVYGEDLGVLERVSHSASFIVLEVPLVLEFLFWYTHISTQIIGTLKQRIECITHTHKHIHNPNLKTSKLSQTRTTTQSCDARQGVHLSNPIKRARKTYVP